MDQSGRKMSVMVIPGSGAGELKGISGTFDIQIANGQHSYDLGYRVTRDPDIGLKSLHRRCCWPV